MPSRPSLCTEAMDRRHHYPLQMLQAVLCRVSVPLPIRHWWPVANTHQVLEGSNRVIPNLSHAEWPQGNAAWPPAVDQPVAGLSCTRAWEEGGCTAASHPVTGSIQFSQAFTQNPNLREDKNGSSNHWVTPLRNSLNTSQSQLTQTPQEASFVLQVAQFIHKIGVPDHTLAGQLCPLSLSSAAH